MVDTCGTFWLCLHVDVIISFCKISKDISNLKHKNNYLAHPIGLQVSVKGFNCCQVNIP